MPNDAKLGLLAGVAGVVAAAVLFYQNQPAAGPAAPAATAVSTLKPSDIFGKPRPPRVDTDSPGTPASTPVSLKTRKEPEGRAVSRTAADDDE